MQTNYASSRGKAKPLLWTSLKPSHQQLSWGDWHYHCFWLRTAGKCTWEPGCTGHYWAGCGWTFFLNKQGQRLPWWDAQKTRRDGAIFMYQVNTRCVPDAEQHLIRGSEFYPTSGSLTTLSWRLNRYREMLSFLCHLFPCAIWICSLKQWRNVCWKVLDLSENKQKIKSLLWIKISICFSWHISPSSR